MALSEYGAPEDEDSPEGEAMPEAPAEQVLQLEQIAGGGIDLAFLLDDATLGRITAQCLEGYERDKAERSDWEAAYETVEKMASGDREAKNWPWPNAANVVYPLITTAALQFGARAYPAIVRGKDVVRARVNGEDPDGQKRQRGDRISSHMNWQLLEDMPEWEEETDKLVHMLPIHGCVFRQVIWDPTYTRPKTALISAKKLVVTQTCRDLETIPLFCKEFELFPHEILERQRDGSYLDKPVQMDGEHKQAGQDMLECHCRYDLDEDGYDEPYIAIIHKSGQQLLSLKPGFWPIGVQRGLDGKVIRVRRHVEFIKYGFVPDFKGGFLDVGFGQLLGEHNTIINTILNQLLDAASSQNAGGGFIGQGASLKGGVLEFAPGEWKLVNVPGGSLRENIVERPTPEPSAVLFQLLGVMIDAGKEVASIRDALSGEVQKNQPATTTLAIIEQGLQVFSSIYKRIYRALGKELALIYQLNGAYLPDQAYFRVMDTQNAIARQDYAAGDFDVMPVADPSVTTSGQRLAKAQFLGGFIGDPEINQREIRLRMLQAAEIEDIERLMPQPTEQDAAAAQAQQAGAMAEIGKVQAGAEKDMAAAGKLRAETIEIIQRTQMAPVEMALSAQAQDADARFRERKANADDQRAMGSVGGVAGPGGNTGVPEAPAPTGPFPQEIMGGAGLEQPGPQQPAPIGPAGAIPGL